MTKRNGHVRKQDDGYDARVENDRDLSSGPPIGRGDLYPRVVIFVVGTAVVGMVASLAFLIFWR
jgi:hypothetical protein